MHNIIRPDAYAMIIGAMKCGTTSLYDYLQGHPEICPSITKEPEFFSENQGHGSNVKDYNDLFSFDASTHKYALEASTGYTKYPMEPRVPENIFNYGINPKFIYLIRNPFDRITSHFNYMQKNASWLLDIDDSHIISTCNYFQQLEKYRQFFPAESILILDFDGLKNNPAMVLKQVYEFLNISSSYFPETYEIANVTQPESKFVRSLNRSKIAHLSKYVPKSLRQFGKTILQKASPPSKRILTNKEKEFIYNSLKEDMCSLHRDYGFNVSKWGFGS